MALKKYFLPLPRGSKVSMARALGISKTWLSLIINGRKHPSAYLSKEIEKYTNGEVKREELRPDLFGHIK
jgi:DNA-binding transcriptional regulator YdaS (Cro superfamily)